MASVHATSPSSGVQAIVVSDDTANHIPVDLLALPQHYVDTLASVLIPHGLIKDRVHRLARDILNASAEPVVALCVLKGGSAFYADLIQSISSLNAERKASVPFQVEFVRLKSYVNDQSSGSVTVSGLELSTLRNKDVLVVEDIVDTGRSAKALLAAVNEAGPKRVRFASLLLKRTPHSIGYIPDYVGFSIPDAFVVGYCLDYNEHYRDLMEMMRARKNFVTRPKHQLHVYDAGLSLSNRPVYRKRRAGIFKPSVQAIFGDPKGSKAIDTQHHSFFG